jgi:hypothetical protein
MLKSYRTAQSPLRRAVQATAVMTAFGLFTRFVLGAADPAMRTWTLVAVAPLLGAFVFFQAAGQPRHVAIGMITLGLGATAFWTVILILGGIRVTGPIDYGFVAFILALPLAITVLGLLQLRKTATGAPNGSPT